MSAPLKHDARPICSSDVLTDNRIARRHNRSCRCRRRVRVREDRTAWERGACDPWADAENENNARAEQLLLELLSRNKSPRCRSSPDTFSAIPSRTRDAWRTTDNADRRRSPEWNWILVERIEAKQPLEGRKRDDRRTFVVIVVTHALRRPTIYSRDAKGKGVDSRWRDSTEWPPVVSLRCWTSESEEDNRPRWWVYSGKSKTRKG